MNKQKLKSGIKKILKVIMLIISVLFSIAFIRWGGAKGLLSYFLGCFTGAIISIYWAYTKGGNNISGLFAMLHDGAEDAKTRDNKKK